MDLAAESAAGGAGAVQRHRWAAAMVHPLSDGGVGTPAPFLEQRFQLQQVTGGEVLRISALGLYRCFIYGLRVGEDLLTPGWTCYDKRLSYQTYEVGQLLKAGDNVIDIWLADGWLRSAIRWSRQDLYIVWGSQLGASA